PEITRARGLEVWWSLPLWKPVVAWQGLWEAGKWIAMDSNTKNITRKHTDRLKMKSHIFQYMQIPIQVSA
uniref:Uncharacterized protein n=1 Tax=Macaca fascicularis TaxID=9541 RepID=A0A7N9CZK8_MACFA